MPSKHLLPSLSLLTFLLLLAACTAPRPAAPTASPTAAPAFTATAPAAAPPTFSPSKRGTTDTGIVYCQQDGQDLLMDVYHPPTGEGPWPVVMYVHGGAWRKGSRSTGSGVRDMPALQQAGFLVVAVDYRLAPQATFPAMIEDVKCAVRFLRAHAEAFNLDPEHIGAFGGSAGGHLVSLLGTADATAGWDDGPYAGQSSRVQAVVDMFGPTDLQTLAKMPSQTDILQNAFGTADPNAPLLRAASPIRYVSSDDPPFLILHGDQDHAIPLAQSKAFAQALQEAGVPVELVVVHHAGHGFSAHSSNPDPSRREITQRIVAFFQEWLR